MNKITLISYPSDQFNLLSLCDHSSRYELFFWGRFRILDFILSLALHIEANEIMLLEPVRFCSIKDVFLQDESIVSQFPPITVKPIEQPTQSNTFLNILQNNDADYFLIINGDNPVIADIRKNILNYISKKVSHGIINVTFDSQPNYTTKLLFIKKEMLISLLQNQSEEIISFTTLFSKIINLLSEKNGALDHISGYFHLINNLVDYFNTNMDIIKFQQPMLNLLKTVPLGSITPSSKKEGLIRKKASVANSILSDSCHISGRVKNSILFPNVTIHKKASIINSIILPNTVIAEDSVVTRTIIDETFNTTGIMKSLPTIGEDSIIGKEDTISRNAIYTNSIYNGITLIGPNCTLSSKIKVGAACYIKGGTDKLALKKNSVVQDSETV